MRSKLFLSAILAFFLAFTSCSNDDDSPAQENPEVVADLIGKWFVEGISVDGSAIESWEEFETYFEFKSNGTLVVSSPGEDDEISTYRMNGEDLVITTPDGVVSFSVKVTSTELEITTEDIDADEEEGNDVLTYYFSKV